MALQICNFIDGSYKHFYFLVKLTVEISEGMRGGNGECLMGIFLLQIFIKWVEEILNFYVARLVEKSFTNRFGHVTEICKKNVLQKTLIIQNAFFPSVTEFSYYSPLKKQLPQLLLTY